MVRISFLTCVFLIGLRLVIGWHFFFEGMNKVRTNNIGESEISKPFSSVGYFAEAEGPLGPKVREIVGDPDAIAIQKLTLAGPVDDKPISKMPVALAAEWDAYVKLFEDEYKLDDAGKKLAEAKLDQAKNDYVLWLTDAMPKPKDGKEPKKIKKTIPSVNSTIDYEFEDKVMQRVLLYKLKISEIRDVFERKNPMLGKDVEKAHLRTLKNEATTMRNDLMKDVDEHTDKLKKALGKIVDSKLAGFSIGVPEDMNVDDRVLELLTLKPGNGADASRMPAALEKQWDDYLQFVRTVGKDALRNDPQRGDAILADAKLRYVRYLLNLDQFDGEPRPDDDVAKRLTAYRTAVAELRSAQEEFNKEPTPFRYLTVASRSIEPARLRKTFIDDITNQTEYLKKNLGGFKDAAYTGVVKKEKEKKGAYLWNNWPETRLEWLDWSVRWGLLVAGGCVLFGLFSRLACLYCASFLVIEFLANPPFPWLPVSPKAEGNYLFINKNLVELLALLVLATIPTGRWLGLDALLSRMWPFRRREAAPEVVVKKPAGPR